ncbi:hypothetical protein Patl1_08957 [Pistacia atlantica]|uniref:Uncharacterized protein n=1 Tax=Pistacia atlantica TaxID=434234 RepID=A0ACC1AHT7_9ROSI|nr:hypothetical protein Patl1_08957 [Pistacia atlantica]
MAKKGTYNEYNYSKFRLWQLTDYDKIIFIDADITVFRNLDLLFHFPQLSATDPPKLYSIHYLGLKPWLCYRDYDCNWDIENQHVYASDVAHERWWKLHDAMDEKLQKFCGITKQRKD